MIACLHIAPFAPAIERRHHPDLTEAPLALALAQSAHVHAACERALYSGVRAGMGLREAYALCPPLRVRPAHPLTYQDVRDLVATTAGECSDHIELDGDDQALRCFADLGRLGRAEAIRTVQAVGRAVRQRTGLAPAIGVATRGRFPAAVIAAQTRQNHLRLLHTTAAQVLVAGQPLGVLDPPAWIEEQLVRLGWRTVGEFAALPAGSVAERFGAEGVRLHRLARGEAEPPLRRRLAQPHIAATHHAADPLTTRAQLEAVVPLLSERVALELGAYRQRAGTLWLRVVQEDGQVQERRRRLREPLAAPSLLDRELVRLLRQVRVTAGVTDLTALASDLVATSTGATQLSLWHEQGTAFGEIGPFLRRRYGAEAVWQVRLDEDATSPTRAVRFIPLEET